MDGIQTLVLIEAALVLLADVVAAVWIFRIYLQNKRRSALAFSLAWVFDFLFVLLSGIGAIQASTLMLATFSALIFYGSVKFLQEESITARYRTLAMFASMPVGFMIYILGVYWYTKDAYWTAISASTFGIAGIFVIAGGLLLRESEEIYKSAIKYLYLSIIVFGIHLIPAALFGIYDWYKPIGFTMSTVLIISMVVAMVKLTSSQFFLPTRERPTTPVDIKPGVMIVNSSEYQKLKEKLKDRPVLAFLRDVKDVPEGWRYYFVTTIPFQGRFKDTINPTNLARMTELAYKYLEESARVGEQGIVVIDCLEYLTVYNSWESLMKFLSKLRDFVIVNKGTLVLVIEKESLENRLYAQLRKLME